MEAGLNELLFIAIQKGFAIRFEKYKEETIMLVWGVPHWTPHRVYLGFWKVTPETINSQLEKLIAMELITDIS